MDKYDVMFEAISELLEKGTITFEQAEALNDRAYDRYMVEANAFNKYIDKKADAADKIEKRGETFKKIADTTSSEAVARKSIQKSNEATDKAKKAAAVNKVFPNPDCTEDARKIKKASKDSHDGDISSREYKDMKKEWMNQHGNKGTRPEDKLKANRYLNAQKALKESTNDLKLSIYEATDAGYLDEDMKDYLLSMIN